MDRVKNENGIYPIVDDMVITLLDDYGDKPTRKRVTLDFSNVKVTNLGKEALAFITQKYNSESLTVTYLRVTLPAVYHFDAYASTHEIESFAEYTKEVQDDYRHYLENYRNEFGEEYSPNYIVFLLSVPRRLQRWLKEEFI